MTKARNRTGDNLGEDLIQSMQEALAHARGNKVAARETLFDDPITEVKRIREKIGLTQSAFATALGVSDSGLRKWEQGQRRPRGAALTLLRVMDVEPETVVRVLRGNQKDRRPGTRGKRQARR